MIVTPNHPLCGRTHRLLDADGVEIVLCVRANTATGEVAVATAEGGRLAWIVDDAADEVVQTWWASFRPEL